MANNNGRITAPISLEADVYGVLGISKTGTYYDVGYACGNSHGKINKLSARKPYKLSGPQPITEAQIKAFNYGMSPEGFTANDLRSTEALTKSLVWGQWETPVPGTDWCRLTDFEGYDHSHSKEAVAEVRLYNSQNSQSQLPVVVRDDQLDLNIGYYGELVLNRDAQVDLLEMTYLNTKLSDMYLTLIIGNNVSGMYERIWAQADYTLGELLGSSGTTASVYLRTSVEGFREMMAVNSGQNIVALGLAAKWTGDSDGELCSLSMYRNVGGVLWNDSYATYGDGEGGGSLPDNVLYGHLLYLTNSFSLSNNSSDGAGTIFIEYTGSYPGVQVTSGGGELNVGVAIQYEVQSTDGSGGVTRGSGRMTDLITFTGAATQRYVEGPSESPWNGRMGVLVQLPSYSPGQQFTVRCKFLIYTETLSTTATNNVFRSDGQGQGIETDWFDAGTVTVNY